MLDSQIIKNAVAYNSYLLDKKQHFTVQNSDSNKLCLKIYISHGNHLKVYTSSKAV